MYLLNKRTGPIVSGCEEACEGDLILEEDQQKAPQPMIHPRPGLRLYSIGVQGSRPATESV